MSKAQSAADDGSKLDTRLLSLQQSCMEQLPYPTGARAGLILRLPTVPVSFRSAGSEVDDAPNRPYQTNPRQTATAQRELSMTSSVDNGSWSSSARGHR